MSDKFAFLQSVRFWNLVVVATVIVLKSRGILVDDTLVSTILEIIALVLGGSTVIRTIDRNSDKKVEAAVQAAVVGATVIGTSKGDRG